MLKENILENESIKPNTKYMENLKMNFPQFFNKDGEFLLDRFENMLKQNDIKFNKEGYELNFLGKSYAKYLSSTKTETFIAPHVEENSKKENKDSENIYIIGDNIDALKHLLGTYSGKIKCIYIDPPYNTGSDGFVYSDDFKFDSEKITEMLGIDEEEAERIINLKGKSSHSAWLTFMYPRLILARELLSDDGVIFISIDDNEQSNLKLICDEIFGEENFIAEFIRGTGATRAMAKFFDTRHDYVTVYAKSYEELKLNELKNKSVEKYKNLDNDKNGEWDTQDLTVRSGGYEYEIPSIDGTKIFTRNWRFSKDELKEKMGGNKNQDFLDIYKNAIYIKEKMWYSLGEFIFKGNNKIINHKKYSKDVSTLKNHTLYNNIGSNKGANSQIFNIFENNIFETPKPLELIKYFSFIGCEQNSIILDFFSGSATIAHAVMQLNAEDGGNRKYILVQLPEKIKEDKPAYEEGYRTIDEIGRERIRRAAKKIKEETGADIDYGFKTYSIETPTNEILTKLDEFSDDPNLLLDDMIEIYDTKNAKGKDSILTTFLVSDGYGLSRVTEEYKLDEYICNKIDKSLYIIDQGLQSSDVAELIRRIENFELDINRIVVYSSSIYFNTMHELKKNISNLRNNKYVELVERY